MSWRKSVAVLGDSIVRIACLPNDCRDVPPTFAIRQPDLFTPVKLRKSRDGALTHAGKGFRLTLRDDGRRLSRNNLAIEWKLGRETRSWKPGQKDRENLGGSFLSLDLLATPIAANGIHAYDPMKGFNSHVCNPWLIVHALREVFRTMPGYEEDPGKHCWEEFHQLADNKPPRYLKKWPASVRQALARVRKFPPGLLSRSGATLFLDDSLPWDADENWFQQPVKNGPQVLYFVRYGNDYTRGLTLLTEILGRQPDLPDWVFGVWFSCFQKWGEKDYQQIAANFKKHDLPLDVVVVDTDWHKLNWHGFDWNKGLFPDPDRFARWLRKHNLKAAFNVHPVYIPGKDTRLKQFFRETGAQKHLLSPTEAPHPQMVDCQYIDLFDKKQAESYFRLFHTPIERQGCGIWWVDGNLYDAEKRDVTPVLNEAYAERGRLLGPQTIDSAAPLVLSRSFGLGAHRSTLHFTGDTFSHWRVLEQEVEMMGLASNCLMCHVSHDIGGFIKGSSEWPENKPPDELMVRWTQFGCLSPIMRFHSDHGVREPWAYQPASLAIMRTFLKYRAEKLAPELRRLAREARRTGVGPCRPMYYQWPDDETAYTARLQYMIGTRLLVSPVVNEEGRVETYFPAGRWKAVFNKETIEGPCRVIQRIPLDTMPVYTLLKR